MQHIPDRIMWTDDCLKTEDPMVELKIMSTARQHLCLLNYTSTSLLVGHCEEELKRSNLYNSEIFWFR